MKFLEKTFTKEKQPLEFNWHNFSEQDYKCCREERVFYKQNAYADINNVLLIELEGDVFENRICYTIYYPIGRKIEFSLKDKKLSVNERTAFKEEEDGLPDYKAMKDIPYAEFLRIVEEKAMQNYIRLQKEAAVSFAYRIVSEKETRKEKDDDKN